eukprot:6277715-Alexandrium_andersonii.AAC.1
MTHAGRVFHPGAYPAAAGPDAPGVEAGAWFDPLTQAACSRAQARCPAAGNLALGGPGAGLGGSSGPPK